MRHVLCAIIGIGCVAAAPGQLIYPIVQDRHLEASVYGYLDWPGDPNEQTGYAWADATDMEPWVESVEAMVGLDPYYAVTDGAGQYSEVDDGSLVAYGLAEHEVLIDSYLTESQGLTESRYRVQFAVPETIRFQISGSIAASADVVGEVSFGDWWLLTSVSVTLDQIAGPVVYSEQVYAEVITYQPEKPVVDWRTVADAGELTPGVYELEIVATVDSPTVMGGMLMPTTFIGETSYVVEVQFLPAQPGPGSVPVQVAPERGFRGSGAAEHRNEIPSP